VLEKEEYKVACKEEQFGIESKEIFHDSRGQQTVETKYPSFYDKSKQSVYRMLICTCLDLEVSFMIYFVDKVLYLIVLIFFILFPERIASYKFSFVLGMPSFAISVYSTVQLYHWLLLFTCIIEVTLSLNLRTKKPIN